MDITNNQIYEKLLEIEKMLHIEKKEEDTIIEEETEIIDEEHEIKNLMDKNENKKFDDIIAWKFYIWDNCPYKKHDIIAHARIGFMCDLTKKSCDFLNCPENKTEEKK